jgi:Protein of unknown function (DUF3237)
MATETAPAVRLETEHVFDYAVQLKPPVAIGPGRFGNRVFYEVREGRVSGPRLNATVLTGGGDWALVGRDGWSRLDVRGQCRTDDGAVLYTHYYGLAEPTPAFTQAVARASETGFDDQYFRISMEVETGDPRYAWLTRSVLIGRGRLLAGPGVAYQVFRVI